MRLCPAIPTTGNSAGIDWSAEVSSTGGYTAFIEGWGLYSEELPKLVGFYKDALSDFGRLSFDAWRAARLVVDTGIHHKRWTRERSIQFFLENTALSELNITSEVDR